jgi:hypothetical protein
MGSSWTGSGAHIPWGKRPAHAPLDADAQIREDLEACRVVEHPIPRLAPRYSQRAFIPSSSKSFGARHNLDHLRQVLSRHTRHGRSDKEGHGRRPVVAYCCPTAAKGSQRGYQSLSLLLVFPANDRLFLVGAVGLEPTLYGFYVRDGHLSPRVGSYREMLCLQVFRKSESANTCRCMPLRVGPVVVEIVVSSVPI